MYLAKQILCHKWHSCVNTKNLICGSNRFDAAATSLLNWSRETAGTS
jgi:hypothetical protein